MSNLLIRVLVAVVAIPLIAAACYFGGAFFFLFTTILIIMSANEFYSMAKSRNIEPLSVLGITSAGTLNAIVYSSGIAAAMDFLIIILLIVMLAELARKRTEGVSGVFANIGTTFTGIIYIGFFGALLTAIRESAGIERVFPGDKAAGIFLISLLATIWICDSAAYFAGMSMGKHKMSKFVSPNKTWEGAVAGFVFAVLAALAAHYLVLRQMPVQIFLGMGIIVGTFGQAGDFVESLFKRDAGVKDSSTIIPGHGGVFDRFDSLIFSAPLIYLLLKHMR
jgi:phosphatidate cytidylyltransferase